MTEDQKQQLYRLLCKSLNFGTYDINTIGQILSDQHISSKNWGYGKLKSMLKDAPQFLQVLEPTDDSDNTLHVRFFSWQKPIAEKTQPKRSAKIRGKAVGQSHRIDAHTYVGKTGHSRLHDERTPISSPFLPDTLIDHSELPSKLLLMISSKSNRVLEAVPAMIEAGYQQAKATQTLHRHGNRLTFSIDQPAQNGHNLVLTFKRLPETAGAPRFQLQYVDDSGVTTPREPINIPKSDNPGQALEHFAFLGQWDQFLEQLATMALPEEWDFIDSPMRKRFILKKYIQYTFYRLQLENKVAISTDRRLAAFNTGLVDPHYDDIYACFVPNTGGDSPWLFKTFTVAGHRGLGKQLVNRFNPLPQSAAYFSRKEDLLFDLDKSLHCDYEHILIENIDRMPLEFLRQSLLDHPRLLKTLDHVEHNRNPSELPRYYDALRSDLRQNVLLYTRLKNRLDDAIEMARKQVRWNFRTAIPSYYPARNSMNLMLPLQLTGTGAIDNVLVVELTPSGNYQGQTLLTMEQAYIDARLVCCPSSNWLTTTTVYHAGIGDDE